MAKLNWTSPMEAGHDIWQTRFPDAEVIFLAGSVGRGEETPYSDLDLVVIFKELPTAYRQSFVHNGWPVEAFVHDPETLNYFFWEKDRPTGVPTLAAMVVEGKEIPKESQLSQSLKALAQTVIDGGPPEWSKNDIDRARYIIADSCDDIRAPRNHAELIASASGLYNRLADFCFRSSKRWSAKNKHVPRNLAQSDPALAERFIQAFDAVFLAHNPAPLLELAESILRPHGGILFDNYKLDAPRDWRKTLPE